MGAFLGSLRLTSSNPITTSLLLLSYFSYSHYYPITSTFLLITISF